MSDLLSHGNCTYVDDVVGPTVHSSEVNECGAVSDDAHTGADDVLVLSVEAAGRPCEHSGAIERVEDVSACWVGSKCRSNVWVKVPGRAL